MSRTRRSDRSAITLSEVRAQKNETHPPKTLITIPTVGKFAQSSQVAARKAFEAVIGAPSQGLDDPKHANSELVRDAGASAFDEARRLARKVAALADERDAARSEAAVLRTELNELRKAHASRVTEMHRQLDAMASYTRQKQAARDAELDAARKHSAGLASLFRGSDEQVRVVLSELPPADLSALPAQLARVLDAVVKESGARAAAERAAAEAAERAAAEAAALASACSVCMDAPKKAVLLPCAHKCVCARCAGDLVAPSRPLGQRTCPICCQMITGIVVPFDC